MSRPLDTMRAVLVMVSIAAVLTAAIGAPAHAGKKAKPRKMKISYTEPAHGTAGVGLCFQGTSCAFFGEPLGKEKSVSVSVEDDLGTDVYASLIQDTNEDGNYLATDDLTVHFCGQTAEPVEVEPNKAVSVWVWQGPGLDPPCLGGASAGVVTATFSS